jgi:hypothetical protein
MVETGVDGSSGGEIVLKFLPFVLVLGVAGCAGAPLVSSGLSADPGDVPVAQLPEATALPPARPVRQASRRPKVKHVVASRAQAQPIDPNEEPADRATRELDNQVHKLENAARQATNSICRGC